MPERRGGGSPKRPAQLARRPLLVAVLALVTLAGVAWLVMSFFGGPKRATIEITPAVEFADAARQAIQSDARFQFVDFEVSGDSPVVSITGVVATPDARSDLDTLLRAVEGADQVQFNYDSLRLGRP